MEKMENDDDDDDDDVIIIFFLCNANFSLCCWYVKQWKSKKIKKSKNLDERLASWEGYERSLW